MERPTEDMAPSSRDMTPSPDGRTWVASWSTSIQGPLPVEQPGAASAYGRQPDLSFALPQVDTEGARDQTLRMIVKPDLWSDTVRIRFSNVFGTKDVTFGAATVALQEYQANLVPDTVAPLTFGGRPAVTIPAGDRVFSDPLRLPFVETATPRWLAGRNLAVSFAVTGSSGPISSHRSAFSTSYLSPPGSGDRTHATDDLAFPYVTTSFLFVDALDVLAPSDTLVVCAFGDSVTDGTFSTPNSDDRWSNVMSRQLHAVLGDRVSVVNQGIAGNGVVTPVAGQPATERVARDVLALSGLDIVVWLEGINDIGAGFGTPGPVLDGYRQVVGALHAAGVRVIGATIPPALAPDGRPPATSPLAALSLDLAARIGGFEVDGYRGELNEFIRSSGVFDAVVDFAAVTTDPASGTLKPQFQLDSGGYAADYLHPNRAAYQVMGQAAADAVLTAQKA